MKSMEIMALFTERGCAAHQDNPPRCQACIGNDYESDGGIAQLVRAHDS